MLSKYGRHFDVHPKGWRLFADLLENAAFGMEMLTPLFPQFFVMIGAAAGAGRSAAALIQVLLHIHYIAQLHHLCILYLKQLWLMRILFDLII